MPNSRTAGTEIILANTYHLHLRPGDALIARRGGLHRFTGWTHPILTDSGGYQVFSLSGRRTLTEEGVTFRSHLDGSLHVLSPERAVDIQARLGSDIAMTFDECLSYPATPADADTSMMRTLRWARRARDRFLAVQAGSESDVTVTNSGQAQFGIVQGSVFPDLRERSVEGTLGIGFEGYAIGGLSVGEPVDLMYSITRGRVRQPAGGPPAVPDGHRHTGRPGRVRGTRNRHVRLRDADAKRSQRPALHPERPHQHQERGMGRGRARSGRGVPVLHLPHVFTGLSAPLVHGGGDDRRHAQYAAQCPVLP